MYCGIVKNNILMTTYTYNLSLDDREVIALTHALKCYMTPEVQELLAKNPSIGIRGNYEIIRDIVERQLHGSVELQSTSTFFQSKN